MLNDVSRAINKRIGLEESDKNFKLAIEPDFDCNFLQEDMENNLGNGENRTMYDFNENNIFDEATEYDPDLTTSLQDETDADDDMDFDATNDFESDVDLFKEVDYKDDFEKDYKYDFEADTHLDKEVDYNDNFDDDADSTPWISANEDVDLDFLFEDADLECGDSLEEEDDMFDEDFDFMFEDVDINIEDPDANVDVNVGGGSDEEISTVSPSSGEVEDLDDDEIEDDSDDAEDLDESFDFLFEDDEYLFEAGADATIPDSNSKDEVGGDTIENTAGFDEFDGFVDDHDDDSLDLEDEDFDDSDLL